MEIERLVANASMDEVKKRVFVHCLPPNIVTAITGSIGGPFQKVVHAADKAWTSAAAAAASTNPTPVATVAAVAGPPKAAN